MNRLLIIYILLIAPICLAQAKTEHAPFVPSVSLIAMTDSSCNDIYEQASFPGGEEALKTFIDEHLKYPEELGDIDIIGRVNLSFTIKKNGKISDIKVTKSLDPILDRRAIDIVKSMPRWIPAKRNGKPISSTTTVSVKFMLQ